ncbi:hypothetical protein HPB50_003106 [Hyalomma asiaticum]|uniref:Uncharacterized protein n=1 Tax=Hyalomma asiaticum TaxID=266040 RepID=A0ACB7TEG8_HYAAI|nr:hypothetical protein HPB50_003106 [Hyalomma asiaticum]
MLGTSTSETQSTGALPPVSELRPGPRAGGGLQLWALLAQMTNNQNSPESPRAATTSEKHIDDMQACASQDVETYHIDSTKMQDINEQSQHHGYQTEAAYSYCDIQRSSLSPDGSLPPLGLDVQQMAHTEAVLDVDNITSAYQQYSCIPLLNIPNSSVSSEQPSLNGLLDDTLYCTAKSNCSIPCPQQRRSAQQGFQQSINRAEKRFLCGKCRRGFVTLDDCCRHLSQAHQAKSKKIRLEWIYTNQPEQMRASTPAEEATLFEPVPTQDSATKQPASALPEFRAGPPRQVAAGSPKQAVKPVCAASKKKEQCRKTSPSDSATSSQMTWRQEINREQGSFICERKGCNVRFRELENLEYHLKCHRADTPDFACPECSVVCLRWRTMTGHLWRHHLCDMELHQCDQCDFR